MNFFKVFFNKILNKSFSFSNLVIAAVDHWSIAASNYPTNSLSPFLRLQNYRDSEWISSSPQFPTFFDQQNFLNIRFC